jgi:hypothetical protein
MHDPIVDQPAETVARYVAADLVRMDVLLEELSGAVERGRLAQARTVVEGFDHALREHVRMEEDLLLPVFLARSGVEGPAISLIAEHRDLARGTGLIQSALGDGDAAVCEQAIRFLREILPGHRSKAHILHPAVDMLLSDPERARLLAKLRADRGPRA